MDRVWSGPKHEQNVNIVYPYTMKKSIRTVYLSDSDRIDLKGFGLTQFYCTGNRTDVRLTHNCLTCGWPHHQISQPTTPSKLLRHQPRKVFCHISMPWVLCHVNAVIDQVSLHHRQLCAKSAPWIIMVPHTTRTTTRRLINNAWSSFDMPR